MARLLAVVSEPAGLSAVRSDHSSHEDTGTQDDHVLESGREQIRDHNEADSDQPGDDHCARPLSTRFGSIAMAAQPRARSAAKVGFACSSGAHEVNDLTQIPRRQGPPWSVETRTWSVGTRTPGARGSRPTPAGGRPRSRPRRPARAPHRAAAASDSYRRRRLARSRSVQPPRRRRHADRARSERARSAFAPARDRSAESRARPRRPR